jgi:hypothetical protein
MTLLVLAGITGVHHWHLVHDALLNQPWMKEKKKKEDEISKCL